MDSVATTLRDLGLSADEISARSKVLPERVRALLEGASPTLAELRALSRGLRISIRTLAVGDVELEQKNELGVLFRAAIRDRGPGYEATFKYVTSFTEAALQILPKKNEPPKWLKTFQFEGESYKEAHRLAHQFRSVFFAGQVDEPILDLPKILSERADAVIGRLQFSRYEGASILTNGYCFIFISPRFVGRMLFTLAHELGHLIAHSRGGTTAIFERPSQIGARGKIRSQSEAFVDAFASVLLVPDRGIGRALKKIRELFKIKSSAIGDVEILVLARMFGVSFEVAARRCEDLELLPAGVAASLTAILRKEFGNPERRANELGLPPRPEINIPKVSDNLIATIVERVNAGDVSVGWASDRFGLSVSEIYAAHAR
jgi:Zn-dependent peptidase ImmA (M78 family)